MKGLPLIVTLIFLLLPLVVPSSYFLSIMILVGIFSLLAIGLNLMFGYTGVISFGHAAFFGIGAYISAILTERMGWSLLTTLPFVIVASALCGLFLGLATIRIGGIYFAISSLGFAEIVRLVALNWIELTNGPMGLVIHGNNLYLIGAIPLKSDFTYYYLLLLTVLLSLYFVNRIRKSWIGRALISIRENETLASSVGVNPVLFKVAVITVGGTIGAIAGVIYVYYYALATPDVAGVQYTTIALLAVLVGGRGTLLGPLLGAAIFAIAPIIIPGALSDLIFGFILFVIILLAPNGLVPVLSRMFLRFKNKFNPISKKEGLDQGS